MRGFYVLMLLVAATLLCACCILTAISHAQDETTAPASVVDAPAAAPAPRSGKPSIVKVAIYVINLGKLDVATGTFTADFYLSLKSREPIPESSFEFINGRGTLDKLQDEQGEDGTYEKFYRVLANLNTPVDMKRFPFDHQKMQIVIEDRTRDIEQVRYEANVAESGMDAAIFFPGWAREGWSIAVAEHEYPVYNSKYSQLVFTINIARIKANAFLKTFLPPCFLMLIVASSFILNPAQIATRIASISSTLVASVMFHISISNQIPPVGYLTFADKFMVLTYFILLVSFFLSLGVFILQGKKEEARAQRLHKLSERIVLIGMPVLYVLFFLIV